MNTSVIHWFRRDLRLKDNAALYHALKSGYNVIPIFIFDTEILEKLTKPYDARVQFIHECLKKLKSELQMLNSDLKVYYGNSVDIWEKIISENHVSKVFTNRDYEPQSIRRDNKVSKYLHSKNIEFQTYKDHVIFEYDEVLKDDGLPYTVYTPYSKKWKQHLRAFHLKPYPTEKYFNKLYQFKSNDWIELESMGFEHQNLNFPSSETKATIIKNYHLTRDIPSLNGTSRFSVHFRFGTLSIREKAAKAKHLNEKWLNELIWRDFYIQIMTHFPHAMNSAFKPVYDKIEWLNNESDFEKWKQGKTGFPIVDAGMRELNKTGYMHNRVRMIVSSFLCKDLLIDWRWGESYFAEKLLDFELASNNGGWQWASGSGVDAAPYFRVFNPQLQLEKFDPQLHYVKKWVQEYGTSLYPKPMVDHQLAKQRCIDTYKSALQENSKTAPIKTVDAQLKLISN
jgi:deoxyribodipyrimidine photo-lyase